MTFRPTQSDAAPILIVLVIVIGLTLRLLTAWQPVPLLIEKTLPDDSFYYFAIARNIIAGHGASINGLTPTNGFHPLWSLVLLAPYALLKDGDTPIHVGLSLAAALDALSALVAFYLVRHITRRTAAGLLAALLYLFNPLVAMESLNGLETALASHLFALTSLVYLTRVRRDQANRADYALLGLVAGLMLLARTDSLFLLLVFGLDGLLRSVSQRRRPDLGEPFRQFLINWGIVGCLMTALLLPWFWWNLSQFGTIVQSSAVAAPSLIRYSLTAPLAQGVPFAVVFQARYLPILNLAGILAFRYGGLALSAMVVALLASRLLTGRFPPLAEIKPLWLPFLGAILPLLAHTFIRWYPRSWYYVPLAWAAAVLGGAIVGRAVQSWPQGSHNRFASRFYWRGGLALLVLILALQTIKSWRAGFYPWQGHMLTGARWAAECAPPEAIIASFNSGLQAYYSQHTIVNLDGVVNWEALEAMEQRALLAYARQRGATHLIDYQAYIFDSFYPFFEKGFQAELRPVVELSPAYPPYGAVGVYEIKSDERQKTKDEG
jgi:hypothetical protein